MNDVHSLRDTYRAQKAAILQSLQDSGASARSIRTVLHKLAALADATLRQLWLHNALSDDFSLVAVGGFGRAELFPHSDVDVLLLLPDGTNPDADSALKLRIEQFIGSCWDTGLEIGSSVRSVTECVDEAAKDVTVQTSLLEARLVTGSVPLFRHFEKQFSAALDPHAFFIAKTLEQRQRHNKYEDTPYALEPNCKESPGGLRDLQTILWVSKAAGFGATWDALAANGLATPYEVKQIKRNEALLSLIRARLHLLAHRREDRVVFDLQTAVAESFGYRQAPEGQKPVMRVSEVLMRRYYWAAKAVTQLNQILLLNIGERLNPSTHTPRPINARFSDKAGMVEVVDDDLYIRDPHAILETFLLYESTVSLKGLSVRTQRALYNARHVMDAKFRRDPVNRATFLRILQQPVGITHAMRLMNQTSVLGRYLWVFRNIVGQMQHDLFHVYTVDQHIIMVLRNVRRFFMAEHAHEYPFCSQLAAGWDKPWVLFVAALFHDIAKGRGGDHSELGARDVKRFCRDHGIASEDEKLIQFLVAEHLTMSRIAQKADLSDPEVIATFAKRVGNERYLTALYLLTVADIRGTSPKVWNAWKGKLLEDLYRLTLRALGGARPHMDAEIEARKQQARQALALYYLPTGIETQLWKSLDMSYFARHDAGDIAWHARMLFRHLSDDKPVVAARISSVGEGLQVLVYAPDRPDVFARICGYFDRASFNIQDARIHTTASGYVLDTFQIMASDPLKFEGVHYRDLIALVENQLAEAVASEDPLHQPVRGRLSRRVKSFPVPPRVSLRPDERGQRWLLSVSASDRSGLLYVIARTLAKHEVNVQLAKVSTLGERVEDTFLVTGASLNRDKAQLALETELLEALAA